MATLRLNDYRVAPVGSPNSYGSDDRTEPTADMSRLPIKLMQQIGRPSGPEKHAALQPEKRPLVALAASFMTLVIELQTMPTFGSTMCFALLMRSKWPCSLGRNSSH